MKIDYNYHTHTYLCGHASGEPEEYVLRAIDSGIKHMGFSEHMPFVFPNGLESGYRVAVEDVKAYTQTVAALREKYKDSIDIKIGFETEYYPEYFDTMLKNARAYGAQYLILGQHFTAAEDKDEALYVAQSCQSGPALQQYADMVIEAMKTGVISYVAHPDVFHFAGDDAFYTEQMNRLCDAAKLCDIPLEINCLGIRDNRHYPNELFWQIAGSSGAPVTIGFDAHAADSAYDEASLKRAEEMIGRYHLNYIGEPKLKDL